MIKLHSPCHDSSTTDCHGDAKLSLKDVSHTEARLSTPGGHERQQRRESAPKAATYSLSPLCSPAVGVYAYILVLLPSVFGADLDPSGHVEITWDMTHWTPDGYTAQVMVQNKQAYRAIELPGWQLQFTWTSGEVIWAATGAEATTEGDCANVTAPGGDKPHSCEPSPVLVDLLPTAEASLRYANCCRSRVLSAWAQDANQTTSMFQLIVGNAANTYALAVPPSNFTLNGEDYTCTEPILVSPTLYPSTSGRRHTQAFKTYKVKCTYAQAEAEPVPGCCVSLSSFFNPTVVPCATCACACGAFSSSDTLCSTASDMPYLLPVNSSNVETAPHARACSADGCPVSIHWHMQQNYRNYWEVLITISNRMLYQNYSDWTLTIEHPGMNNITENDRFNMKNILLYGVNNTAIFYGKLSYNSHLDSAPAYVQTTLLLGKNIDFTLENGWAYPRNVVFNGQTCVMPTWFPTLPNEATRIPAPLQYIGITMIVAASLWLGL